MSLSRIVLSPFSALYRVITDMRNFLYDQGRRHSTSFTVPVINVGNLTVGGTGKSPMIEYLVAMLAGEYAIATLSRGYGRKTRGFRLANEEDDATTLGDEPYQFYRKFGDKVTVAVGEERALAIPSILLERPDTGLILLDDAYQHRAVSPSFNILLSDFNRPFYEDVVLPGGRLRESRKGARRADVVVVTKCPPDLSGAKREGQKQQISRYTEPDTPVFFTSIGYDKPQAANEAGSRGDYPMQGAPVLAFSGIARAEPFTAYLSAQYSLKDHLSFPDHHTYTEKDLAKIREQFEILKKSDPGLTVITTEKDAARLGANAFPGMPLFYIPIRPVFLDEEDRFRSLIFESLQKEVEG